MDRTVDVRATVIVATWNAAGVLGACLDSIRSQRVAGGFETIVVDNASTDATPHVLDRCSPEVRIIRNAGNVGFAGANNQAAREAHGRVLVFLNPDTELLGPDALERLVAAAEAPGVGLAGPLLLNPDGSLQPSCTSFPGVWRAVLLATGTFRLLPDPLRARLAADRWSHAVAADTDWVMGAALAMRSDLFRDLGGFWSTMYAEEEDLAYRVRARGLRVRFDPSARVMHIGNHSGSQRWSDAQRAGLVAAADLAFLRRHYARPRAAAIRTIMGAGYTARVLTHALLGHRDAVDVYRTMVAVYAPLGRPRDP